MIEIAIHAGLQRVVIICDGCREQVGEHRYHFWWAMRSGMPRSVSPIFVAHWDRACEQPVQQFLATAYPEADGWTHQKQKRNGGSIAGQTYRGLEPQTVVMPTVDMLRPQAGQH